jgi:hypothetical protein
MAVSMKWPATCKTITQGYGVKNARYARGYHTGIDMGCMNGSPIFAAHDGTVIVAGWQNSYGNTVEISAGGGLVTSYHHMSRIAAKKGQNVSAGTVIGYIGSTGMSTGPHLHFEVRINGKDVNPAPYLSGAKVIDANYETPAGFSDVLEFPGKMVDMFKWMTDTVNWYRVGMVFLGVALLAVTFLGMSRASSLGKSAVSAVGGTVKKAVKSNAKS